MATENRTRITCDRCGKLIFDGAADKGLNISRYSITFHFYPTYGNAEENDTLDVCEACYVTCSKKTREA